MDDSISDIINSQFKKLLPLIITILLVLFSCIPLSIPFSKFLRPDVSMVCIYFWSLYRRDLFGPISVILLGIVSDSLSYLPLGVNIFIYAFTYLLSVSYIHFINSRSFAIGWLAFSVISFIAFFVKWLLMSFYYSQFLYILSIFPSYMATVLFYPLIVRINIFVQYKFLSNEEVIYEQR